MTRFLLDTHAIIHWQIGSRSRRRSPSLHAVLVSRDAVFAAYDAATRWV